MDHSLTQALVEVCPSCGRFVTALVDTTGWCALCTLTKYGFTEGGERLCYGCGNPVGDQSHRKCRACRDADWLLQHADEIDRCLANGISVYKARNIIQQNSQQTCLRCGGSMNKATHGVAYFCGKPRCRSANTRLKKLIYIKGYDRTEALNIVLSELK